MWQKLSLIIIVLAVFAGVYHFYSHRKEPVVGQIPDDSSGLQLSSPAFEVNGEIPADFTCKGNGGSPLLNVSAGPAATKSLALVVHDPDATGGDFTHWLVWNISPDTISIDANNLPAGAVQGANGAGESKYYPPCPPAGSGVHHYTFELYALNKNLDLKSGSSRTELQAAMSGNVLGHTILTGTVAAD